MKNVEDASLMLCGKDCVFASFADKTDDKLKTPENWNGSLDSQNLQ